MNEAFNVLSEVNAERQKQDEKWGEQNHTYQWTSILGEEYGEVCEAMNRVLFGDNKAKAHNDLRMELIQCAAVCVAWVECLDRNNEKMRCSCGHFACTLCPTGPL